MVDYSFVIPAYNNKALLSNCLESLNNLMIEKNQTYEVIVVDDGSGEMLFDYIYAIPRTYQLHYSYIHRNHNSCRAKARNEGWRTANGKYVIFIDSDILVRSDYLCELDKCFRENEDKVIVGLRIMIPEPVAYENIKNGTVFAKYKFNQNDPRGWEFRHHVFGVFSYNMLCYKYPWLFAHSHNMVVPRCWLERVGGFDEGFKGWGHEDIELGYRLQQEKVKIIINTNMEVLHQFHSSPMRDSDDPENIAAFEKNCHYFLNKHSGLFGLPYTQSLEILKGDKIINPSFNNPSDEKNNKHVINYFRRDELEMIKEHVHTLCKLNEGEIIVNDYTGESDLLLWIQNIKAEGNIPKYYPVGRKLENISPPEKIR